MILGMTKEYNFTISKLICPDCGGEFPIPRSNCNKREKGHHKKLWCPFCKREVNMLEIRENDYYLNKDGKFIGGY